MSQHYSYLGDFRPEANLPRIVMTHQRATSTADRQQQWSPLSQREVWPQHCDRNPICETDNRTQHEADYHSHTDWIHTTKTLTVQVAQSVERVRVCVRMCADDNFWTVWPLT